MLEEFLQFCREKNIKLKDSNCHTLSNSPADVEQCLGLYSCHFLSWVNRICIMGKSSCSLLLCSLVYSGLMTVALILIVVVIIYT